MQFQTHKHNRLFNEQSIAFEFSSRQKRLLFMNIIIFFHEKKGIFQVLPLNTWMPLHIALKEEPKLLIKQKHG